LRLFSLQCAALQKAITRDRFSDRRAPYVWKMRDSLAPKIETAEPSPLLSLALRAAGGDLEATREVIEAIAPRVVRVVRAIVGPSHVDADDVAQQALIAVVQAMPRFRGECEPASYATRIAVRTAITARRKARTWTSRHDAGVELAEIPSSKSDAPLEEVRAERRRAILRELLDALPEEQADALALKFVMGWSLEEIAAASSVPVNTVRSRMRLAKEAMRKRIEADPSLADELEVPT
jgi:RNA polymerase sigma-70 factor (ECF subfamily)